MSADNLIAILITHDTFTQTQEGWFERLGEAGADVWRVVHTSNPEAYEHYRAHEIHNLGYWMAQTFAGAQTFSTQDAAWAAARTLADTKTILEHGIMVWDARPLNFPGH